MILLLAVVAGLLAGAARAWIGKRKFHSFEIQLVWLVVLAVIPQLLAFHLPSTSRLISDSVASAILVCSQLLLLIFAIVNRNLPGFWALGLGLGLNLLVILANGGWMPISLEVANEITPTAHNAWQIGDRFGMNKDIILSTDTMKFPLLSDRFTLPWQIAFSLGDILIALGAFWLLWAHGAPQPEH